MSSKCQYKTISSELRIELKELSGGQFQLKFINCVPPLASAMDWEGLSSFLQEIRLFLKQSNGGGDKPNEVESLIEKCEFYISTTIKLQFNDEVDTTTGSATYLNMTNNAPVEQHPNGGGESRLIELIQGFPLQWRIN